MFFYMENDLILNDDLMRVLVVDDERPIRRFLHTAMESQYTIFEAESGRDALQIMIASRPDIVLLDLGLPDIDGVEVTRRLREWTLVPVIIISVRDREEDKVAALDAGADDYLTKPFSVNELMARIRAALRHCTKPEIESVYQSGDLMINLARREVRQQDQLVLLTPTEYDILRALVTHAGKVLTHHQLIHTVWGGGNEADAHLLRVNISNLRRKIEKDPLRPRHIITEPGVGYRLSDIE
jgi:two-component system, OmpR family, KDP operon response regulator KdpE